MRWCWQIALAAVLGSCGPVNSLPHDASELERMPARSLEIAAVDSSVRQSLIAKIIVFGESEGYEVATRTFESSTGENDVLELHRSDVWIHVGNQSVEYPGEIPVSADGWPLGRFDSLRFYVHFYSGQLSTTNVEPIDDAVSEFEDAVMSIDGVSVANDWRPAPNSDRRAE